MSDINPRTESSDKDDEEVPNKKFYEKVREYNTGERDTNPFKELPQWKIWMAVAGLSSAVVIGFALLLAGNLGGAFLALSAPFIGALILTETGREFLSILQEEMEEGNQQQQQDTSGIESKKICPDCGWQNPKEGNFCHDCGSELR